MKKKDTIQNFKDAFDDFLEERHLKKKFEENKIISNWEALMGASIAKRTKKIFFKQDILFIQIISAPLKQEMMALKEEILEKIKTELKIQWVKDIKIL